jgi:hypothetical protein
MCGLFGGGPADDEELQRRAAGNLQNLTDEQLKELLENSTAPLKAIYLPEMLRRQQVKSVKDKATGEARYNQFLKEALASPGRKSATMVQHNNDSIGANTTTGVPKFDKGTVI